LDCSCRLFSTSAILAEPILQDVDTMLPEVWRRSENGKVETRHPNRKSRRLRFDAIAQLKWVNDPPFGDVRVGEHIAEGINWRAWHSAPVHFLQPFKGGSLFETRRQYPDQLGLIGGTERLCLEARVGGEIGLKDRRRSASIDQNHGMPPRRVWRY
jgi:hypothetical protein